MDRLTSKTIHNDETKEPSSRIQGQVALEAIREEMTMAELSKKYGVHLLPTGICLQTPRGDPDCGVETGRD